MRHYSLFTVIGLIAFSTSSAMAQAQLPAGPGHDETVKVCGKCHAAEQAASLRQSRTGWEETISKMVSMGSEGTDEEYEAILKYLTTNFGPEAAKPININNASPAELEAALGLTRTESAAVIQYRTDKGNFKSIDDLKQVPGLDFKKVEAKKARLAFQ
jgi:competence protein ComEA